MSTIQMTVRVKIVLIGDGMVGKTTLVKSFLKGTAISDTSYKRTVGADIFVKNDIYEFDNFGKVAFNWMIWDLAGQPTFKMVRGQYYKGAQAGIAVFDVSRPQTFKNLHYWIAEMFKHAGGPKPLIIVGNKIDLRDKMPCLSPETGEKYAQKLAEHFKLPIRYLEASALNHINVEEAFRMLAENILKAYLKQKK